MPASDSEIVRVKFWGTRGSVPTPGAGTVQYGGNTACIEITWGESNRLILDAGTGIRLLGEDLARQNPCPKRIDILFSHLHWDHIQGLPFFIPLYLSGTEIHLWGGGGKGVTLDLMMDHQLHSAFFPIGRASLSANLVYHLVTAGEFQVGDAKLRACSVNHPGGCFGYRIEVGGKSIIYATDREAIDYPTIDWTKREEDFSNMAQGADLMIHDAQYTEEEYLQFRRGWGHSSVDRAINTARAAGIKKLILFHHDPSHSDDYLQNLEHEIQRKSQGLEEISMAIEGQTVTL